MNNEGETLPKDTIKALAKYEHKLKFKLIQSVNNQEAMTPEKAEEGKQEPNFDWLTKTDVQFFSSVKEQIVKNQELDPKSVKIAEDDGKVGDDAIDKAKKLQDELDLHNIDRK